MKHLPWLLVAVLLATSARSLPTAAPELPFEVEVGTRFRLLGDPEETEYQILELQGAWALVRTPGSKRKLGDTSSKRDTSKNRLWIQLREVYGLTVIKD